MTIPCPGWQILFPLLPRPWLNAAEIRLLPGLLNSVPTWDEIRSHWSRLRVALIKQSLYRDLYCAPPGTPPGLLAASSLRRTGPLGWILDLQASFWLVHEDPAEECRIWEESVGSNPATRSADLQRARDFPNQPLEPPHPFAGMTPRSLAVSVDEVPWEEFDVVVSMDVSVPLRIVRSHPRIHWVFFPTDPGTPSAKRGRRQPPAGYATTLTHTHRRFPVRPGLGDCAVECPYSFQSSWSWDQVWAREPRRQGVMVEHQTHDLLSSTALEQLHSLGPVWKPAGAVTEVADNLRRAKYYLRLNGGPLTGNGQIEAIMAGCLAVGNPDTYVQRSLFTPQTVCRTPAEAMEKILHWESHPQRLEKELQDQRTMAEWICFRRPAWQLLQRIRQTR